MEHPALGPSPTPLNVSGSFWIFPKDSPLLQALCCRVPGSTRSSLVLRKAVVSDPETPLPELLTLLSSLNPSPLATPSGYQTPFSARIFKDSQEHPLQFPELQVLPREFQSLPFIFRSLKPQRTLGPLCTPFKGSRPQALLRASEGTKTSPLSSLQIQGLSPTFFPRNYSPSPPLLSSPQGAAPGL